jgi:acetyl esterase
MLEAQARYIVQAVKYMRRRGKPYVAVRPHTMANFIAKIDGWMQGTVWTTQCSNYFRAANGRVVTQWPRSARAFWGLTRRFKAGEYIFDPPPRRNAAAAPLRTAAHRWPQMVSDRLDPALRSVAVRTDLSLAAIPAARESLDRRRHDTAQALDATGVDIIDAAVSAERSRSIPVRIYHGGPSPAPGVIYCHAGAFVLGNLDTDHRQCTELARRGQVTLISVDYRLAPEHPYPAALDDVIAVLEWATANADRLALEANRLAVAGSSAGAALAACVAQRAADGSLPSFVFQLLHQPVLDDRSTPSKAEFVATPGFDGPAANLMWRHYLADTPPTGQTVPARRSQLAGIPSAFISCSELDPLRDEALQYASNLLRAGVATELHAFPGTCHGFDSLLPEWETSRQLFALQGRALHRALSMNR